MPPDSNTPITMVAEIIAIRSFTRSPNLILTELFCAGSKRLQLIPANLR